MKEETKTLFYKKYRLDTEEKEQLLIAVEVLRVPNKNKALINQNILISLLARVIIPPESRKKVLVDVHNNKEVHVHIDQDREGKAIGLNDIDEIFDYFEKEVNKRFNFKKEFKI